MVEQPVALITGTSRGIGNHLAHFLVERGYFVVGCSRGANDTSPAKSYVHHSVDLGTEEPVMELFKRIRTDVGRLDVVVNNAGVNPTLALTALTPYQAAQSAFQVNVLGTFLVCREAVKLMMRRKFGRIINVSSMAVRHEVAGDSIYTATKAAVTAFSRVLAKEVYSQGITCNVIAPSAIETELMSAIDPQALRDVLKRNAVPELGSVEDVSNAIAFLLQPESRTVTGQVIYLGGV